MENSSGPRLHLFFFGQIGSGKSHLGQLLAEHFGFHYHDGDWDIPPEAANALRVQEPFTEAMRDEFARRIDARIRQLTLVHPRFVVAQSLFKARHRTRLLADHPSLRPVWIRSTPELIERSLRARTGHIATAYYASRINPSFEPPEPDCPVIDNCDDQSVVRRSLAALLSRLDYRA